MQGYKDNQLVTDNNAALDIAIITALGDREEQQDSFGYFLTQNEAIVSICDGMGGHEGGKLASGIAVEGIINAFERRQEYEDASEFLLSVTNEADKKVAQLKREDGKALKAGSTMATIVIENGEMYWVSVGDSRIYLNRGNEFIQVTFDHVYRSALREQLAAGEITQDIYDSEKSKGDALISFLGIGGLRLIDYNNEPFELMKEDKIIIMTDGLYKLVKDEELKRIVENFSNIKETLQAFDMKAKKKAKTLSVKRDNMTVALIKIK